MQRLKILTALALSLTLSACGLFDSEPGPALDSDGLVGVELLMVRGHLTAVEFEQYKLEGNRVFAECGKIKRGKFQPETQKFVTITLEQRLALMDSLANGYSTFGDAKLPQPEKNSTGFFGPGEYVLSIRGGASEKTLRTGVDNVASGSRAAERRLVEFTQLLRAVPPETMCGNESFYGITRSSE
jgi:hypothetical protein